MIIPKALINTVASKLVKHFKLDKIMAYVFDKNELDEKVEEMEKRLNNLEKVAYSPKKFKCNYKKEK